MLMRGLARLRFRIARWQMRRWNTDWDTRSIDLDELISGGPPRDGIPPIDRPRFITVPDAGRRYSDTSPIVTLEIDGDARAYPLDILMWHEIVNDEVGGVPVAVTFCPLCNSAVAYDRRLHGRTLSFGTSGLLRRSDLVMWDRETESLWQQIGGEAIVGELTGARLTPLPASIDSWWRFRQEHPDGQILSHRTGMGRSYGANPYHDYDAPGRAPFLFAGPLDDRLDPMARVVTLADPEVHANGGPVAYPHAALAQRRVWRDQRAGRPLAVLWVPGCASALDAPSIDAGRDVGCTAVLRTELDGEPVRLRPNPHDPEQQTFLDATDTVWSLSGRALDGPRRGARLQPLPHGDQFWFAWAAFYPDTTIAGSV